MVKTEHSAIQLPAAVTVVFFIVIQQLTTFPYQALATLPGHSSHTVQFSSDDTETGGNLHRSQFPQDFIFGSGTSAYQVEGAAWVDGKGPSVWDNWSQIPGKVRNGDTGDVAVDEYHRYEEDLDLIAAMNMDSYRFSIAWTRIFPTIRKSFVHFMDESYVCLWGPADGLQHVLESFPALHRTDPLAFAVLSHIPGNGTGPRVNVKGVAYYNRVIDAALRRGIIPVVTLYHWDLPQVLQDEYGGWLSRQSIDDFAAYAEVCFGAFGDRVKYWTTFNEPRMFLTGFSETQNPPGRTSGASTEPYIGAHNVLLAHAAAVDIYRRKFQAEQHGVVGITVDSIWGAPETDSPRDIAAAERYNLFNVAWFLDPIYFGDYPEVMRKNVGSRLPRFSEEEVLKLKGSLDFIGLNHYTTCWVTEGPGPFPNQESNPSLDQHCSTSSAKDGIDIGPARDSSWIRRVPWGLYDLLKWTSARYNTPIFVTENGMSYNDDVLFEDSLHDTARIEYYQEYVSSVLQAVRDGVDVRGYYAWSLLDNFEWAMGYYLRFGLTYVDYNDGLKRYPKDSARWFSQILSRERSSS